ncbi:MAG TPA: TadE/TadG family type IV pilus assembly protein [Rhizomicrobium sp.]|nr:TadE/TadG family type IV pilus assembly protein [Rhizomicrobium sp.]
MTRNPRWRGRSRSPLRFFAHNVLRDNRGSPAIEFGLLAPILMLLLLGVVDFGRAYWDQVQVTAAAQAGAGYAVKSGFDATSIANAVTSGGPAAIQASPAPTESCGCPNATSGITSASGTPPNCTGICASGGSPGTYVTVNSQVSFTTLFPWPGLPRPTPLTSTTTVRIQ